MLCSFKQSWMSVLLPLLLVLGPNSLLLVPCRFLLGNGCLSQILSLQTIEVNWDFATGDRGLNCVTMCHNWDPVNLTAAAAAAAIGAAWVIKMVKNHCCFRTHWLARTWAKIFCVLESLLIRQVWLVGTFSSKCWFRHLVGTMSRESATSWSEKSFLLIPLDWWPTGCQFSPYVPYCWLTIQW